MSVLINAANTPTNMNNQVTEQQQNNVDYSIRGSKNTDETENLVLSNKTNNNIKKDEDKTVELTVVQLEKVAQQLQDFIGEMNRSLEFLVDKDSGRDVIKVLDRTTGDLVKQYPSEEVLTLISKLSDAMGNLVDTEI